MISMRMFARGTALDFVTERTEHMDGISARSVLFALSLLRTLFDRLVRLDVSRDTCAKDVSKAFKSLSLRAHLDKGSDQADFQCLSFASEGIGWTTCGGDANAVKLRLRRHAHD